MVQIHSELTLAAHRRPEAEGTAPHLRRPLWDSASSRSAERLPGSTSDAPARGGGPPGQERCAALFMYAETSLTRSRRTEIAVLVDDIAAHKKATKEQAAAYHAHREAAILSQQTQQRKQNEEKRVRMAEVHKEKIEAARLEKQKAREAKRQAALEAGTLFEVVVPDLNGETTGPPPSTRNPASATVKAQPPVSSLPYTIIIQPSSLDMPWYDPASATYETLDAAKEAGLYHYPSTSTQKARCKVFEDLWRKGHFMGGGLRFGGDFLVYPGESRAD